MSIQKMIACIERNHAVMDAQMDRLAEFSPELLLQDAPSSVSDLLNSSVLSHLQGAAKSLRGLAEVEAFVRGGIKMSSSTATSNQRTPEVVDVEFEEVKTREVNDE